MHSIPIFFFYLLTGITTFVWFYLLLLRGEFWRLAAFDGDRDPLQLPQSWPRVVAIVPARDETETVGQTVASLAQQEYPGEFSVVIVDDHSEDGTADVARKAARQHGAESRVKILMAAALGAGWTGKLWALQQGVEQAGAPELYWFTDADIVHAPDTLRRLVARAEQSRLDLTSLMVLLHAGNVAEKLLIPPFLFFFLKLYPPRWIADERRSTAGAAGGCILLRGSALQRMGGLAAIRGEVIDDCAMARAVKRSGGRIWMGLTRASVSLRVYRGFAEVRDMIARLAFTQLHYSVWFLFGAVVGMFVTYLAPIVLLFAHSAVLRAVGLTVWFSMGAMFLPTVRFYRLSAVWAWLLPAAATFFSYATLLSATRYWLGRSGQWKGRVQAPSKG